MRRTWGRIRRLTGAVLAILACSNCRGDLPGDLDGRIRIDGSSTVYPITEAVAEEFRYVQGRVRVTVGVSGTGGGFKRFAVGETDLSDASRPIKQREMEEAALHGVEFVEIPVALDGLTIVVNQNNDWAMDLNVEDLRQIFLDGRAATSWNQVRDEFPDVPIKIFAPGTDSGTFDYFKDVVAGDSGSIRADMSVSEDDNSLVRGVAGEHGSIGFFGCAYYFENQDKLRAVKIDGGDGPVEPTRETIRDGSYKPFSRPLFLYANRASLQRAEVRAFLDFYFVEGPALVTEVGYVPLPDSVARLARAAIAEQRTGSWFSLETGASEKER